jgi:hypothetical protein
MDLASVVFVKQIFESVSFFFNNPENHMIGNYNLLRLCSFQNMFFWQQNNGSAITKNYKITLLLWHLQGGSIYR